MAARLNWVLLCSAILSVFHLYSCFHDSDEANGVQPELRIFHQSCALKMDEGPCKAAMDRFYFNVETRGCEKFIYGGCQGNANNFDTLEECEEMCLMKPDKNPCHLDDEPGPCRGLVPRYFFNHASGECERFFYGGCFGNANNFRTKAECQAKCHKHRHQNDSFAERVHAVHISLPEPKEPAPEADSLVLAVHANISKPTEPSLRPLLSTGEPLPEFCFSKIDRGTCSDSIKRFIYNSKRKQCQVFYYTGCGGNKNNFPSKLECMKACMKDRLKVRAIRIKKTRLKKIIKFKSV
ncbi:tissue factor pathway inhibitor a [Megalops cyprinoides]|uniref:tissue factor pathway inhibitor a n=1 Tax=Megalops cyprinoides TaxID=118141 RepID=UPI00186477F9|nr:tissue factor pathway inhibitor a [Megalops cyprinoides]